MIQNQLLIIGHFCFYSFHQILGSHFSDFCYFHTHLRILILNIVITSYHKLRCDRKLLCSQTQGLLGDFIRYAFCLNNYSTRSNRSHEALGVTFTFTHTYISRLSRDGFIREDTDPNLSLTLHISRHCNTCSFNLTAGNPLCLQSLDSERTESQLVASLSIALLTALLLSSELCFFRL